MLLAIDIGNTQTALGVYDGAKLEQVELEGLAVVRGGQETRDARDLAGVARLGQLQQPCKGLGAGLGEAELVLRLKGAGEIALRPQFGERRLSRSAGAVRRRLAR